MSFLPQAFLSNINSKEGLAKPSRFEVILPIPQYINSFIGNSIIEKILNLPNVLIAEITDIIRNEASNTQSRSDNPSITRYLALQCEAAELPGRTLLTQEAKIYGPTFKVPYQTQYTDMNLTFLCTNEFYERKLFERWIESIMPSDTNNLRYARGEKSRYLTNIKIIQYDEFIRQIYAVELIDAFPIGVAPQTLSWSEDNFHRMTVQFAYQKYKVIYEGNYDIVNAAVNLFGAKFGQFVDRKAAGVYRAAGTIFDRII
jgi:hypothetical protein